MKTIELSCKKCGNKFNRLLKDYKQHVKRGQLNFYCSHVCHRPNRSKLVSCQTCGKEFNCTPDHIRRSKSGFNYCSRKCSTINNNHFRQGELHPHWKGGIGTYRSRKDITKCESCGELKYWLLMVHHKDSNRLNNRDDNLIVMCYNCHAEQHLTISDGLLCVNYKVRTSEEIKSILAFERQENYGTI